MAYLSDDCLACEASISFSAHTFPQPAETSLHHRSMEAHRKPREQPFLDDPEAYPEFSILIKRQGWQHAFRLSLHRHRCAHCRVRSTTTCVGACGTGVLLPAISCSWEGKLPVSFLLLPCKPCRTFVDPCKMIFACGNDTRRYSWVSLSSGTQLTARSLLHARGR